MKYRILRAREIVRVGDQVESVSGWQPCELSIGAKAGLLPAYRRPVHERSLAMKKSKDSILQDYKNENHVIFRDQKEATKLILYIIDKIKSGATLGIMRRLEREGWRLLTKDRDNWKHRAVILDGFIRKMQVIRSRGGDEILRYRDLDQILTEADMLNMPKLPKHFGEMRFKAACRKTGRGKG